MPQDPRDALYHSLNGRVEIERIGDCSAPGIIASAVYSGHRYARAMDVEPDGAEFRRERAIAPPGTASV